MSDGRMNARSSLMNVRWQVESIVLPGEWQMAGWMHGPPWLPKTSDGRMNAQSSLTTKDVRWQDEHTVLLDSQEHQMAGWTHSPPWLPRTSDGRRVFSPKSWTLWPEFPVYKNSDNNEPVHHQPHSSCLVPQTAGQFWNLPFKLHSPALPGCWRSSSCQQGHWMQQSDETPPLSERRKWFLPSPKTKGAHTLIVDNIAVLLSLFSHKKVQLQEL